jgi:hypothetical protein
MVSHSFFAHKKAVSHYSTKYNVTITLAFDRADLFGYLSPGSRDLNLTTFEGMQYKVETAYGEKRSAGR